MAEPDVNHAGHYHFIRGSRYAAGLCAFIDTFGSDRVRVIRFEGLTRDPQRCLDRLCGFLEIAPFVPTKGDVRRNEARMARNPLTAWIASRYRYSSARNLVSRVAPDFVRNGVRSLLMNARPSSTPPPMMTKDEKALLESHLRGEFDTALAICRDNGILL
jgi:hypothetical protein